MAKNIMSGQSISGIGELGRPKDVPPEEIAELLDKAGQALNDGRPEKAIEVIVRSKVNSPWALNALGVCQMRFGNSKTAVDLFRGLVLASGGVLLRSDIPTVFKANFATALLLNDNLHGCLDVLAEIRGQDHQAVTKLRDAVARWKASLTGWQKILWYVAGHAARPLTLDFPPGDLM